MDVGCICCGADLTALFPHPLSKLDAMCEPCRREVRRLRAIRHPLRLETGMTLVRAGWRPAPGGGDGIW
jgi:hypothetical protein